MRARLVGAIRPSRFEWIIVSRFGRDGDHLSIAWTTLPARPGEAPIQLTPQQTALAVRRQGASARAAATFQLIRSLPEGLTVAGDFVPAEGYVRLYGGGERLRLRSEGRCLKPGIRSDWHVSATRASWMGEFVESASPPEK
ncbi:MAG: hypothetical protein P4L90_09365 [Rhodopila sp.]|nr:hypothetical protein [Rhodopila sp.]